MLDLERLVAAMGAVDVVGRAPVDVQELAYSTDGVSRRGPVTLRARDLEKLKAALGGKAELAATLGL